MPQAKIAILMSTYNGEKYLAEQIQSIIRQDYSNWHLYIRDDGSTDNTINLIKEWENKDTRITFLNQDAPGNLGVTGSFMNLLENTNADYYMFSDQDDYWMKDKISVTLEKMQNSEEDNLPICVHSNLTVVDANLKGKTLMNGPKKYWSDFKSLLFSNCVTGCTMMINQPLKELVDFQKINSNKLYMHDWWIALIAAAFGKVVYLNRSTILYRQHQGNVIGSSKKIGLLDPNDPLDIRVIKVVKVSSDFWNAYGNKLTGDNRRYIENYASLVHHKNPLWNLRIVIKCPPARATLKGNIAFSLFIIKEYKRLSKLN